MPKNNRDKIKPAEPPETVGDWIWLVFMCVIVVILLGIAVYLGVPFHDWLFDHAREWWKEALGL